MDGRVETARKAAAEAMATATSVLSILGITRDQLEQLVEQNLADASNRLAKALIQK